jgi:hypothetical protein
MAGGRPPIFDSPEQMEKAIEDYFNPIVTTSIETNHGSLPIKEERKQREKATVTGLALHLGFESRQSIYDYKENEQFSYIIKRALLYIENCYEVALYGNNVTGPIFALKNMGWKDKTESETKVTVTNLSGMETADLKKLEELLSKAK